MPEAGLRLGILCQFSREQFTRGRPQHVDALRAAWSATPRPAGVYPAEWHDYVGRLLGYTEPSGPVDERAARRMADDLLIGPAGRVGEVMGGEPARPGWWRFTLRTSVTEHVDVSAATGAFEYTLRV